MINFQRIASIRKNGLLCVYIGDDWNSNFSFICSEHFSEDVFACDLRAELTGTS